LFEKVVECLNHHQEIFFKQLAFLKFYINFSFFEKRFFTIRTLNSSRDITFNRSSYIKDYVFIIIHLKIIYYTIRKEEENQLQVEFNLQQNQIEDLGMFLNTEKTKELRICTMVKEPINIQELKARDGKIIEVVKEVKLEW